MLFSICGPSSCGKTTLCNDLKKYYSVIGNQYAREVMEFMNLTVDEISTSKENIKKFQEKLLEYKRQIEFVKTHNSAVYITERSYIDLFIYYYLHLESQEGIKLEDVSKELDSYYIRCLEYSLSFYKKIFYLSSIPNLEDDGVRIINRDFINKQKELFESIFSRSVFKNKVFYISTPNLLERRYLVSSEIEKQKHANSLNLMY